MTGPNSLHFPPLGGAILFFFAHLFGSLVSLENPVKTVEKCRYHWGKLRGLGHVLGNFVFDLCLKICQTTMPKHRQPNANEFVELSVILTLSSQTLQSTHIQTLRLR